MFKKKIKKGTIVDKDEADNSLGLNEAEEEEYRYLEKLQNMI
jgi:hypothetical protein